MANSISDFWKLLQEIQGTSTDLTDSLKAIAKNQKTVSETLFSNIIDQAAYNSRDYQRIRSFLRDWYAAHRSLTSYQSNINDIYQMPNDQLDELFQSFGYDLSATLRDPITNTPPLNKINFFLDLVNLYKIKGTPQALLNVLQYYGLVDVDIYEMSLQFEDRDTRDNTNLIFKGKVITGTTGDTSPLYLPFDLLTQEDPHWMQTESQIRTLFDNNLINFPSQTPYFAVKPLFDEEATDAATGILQRKVQDEYDIWESALFPAEDSTAVLDQDAVISVLGETCSLLTLYLSCIYIFNKEFTVGSPALDFICYDGTNTLSADIIAEFRDLTDKPDDRADAKEKYAQYLETFTRDISENFLQTHSDAGLVLGTLNPTIKTALDNLSTDNITLLGTLLTDLGEWVRTNISYGFINMSYILFGMDSLFNNLREVIDFFKPYRARLIPLELIQLRNRLFNTIIVEDDFYFDENLIFHDFLVGDSTACCADSTCSDLYSPREYYDCGSYHDIGAVMDDFSITYNEIIHDYLACPGYDSTGYVISEFSYSALSGEGTSVTIITDGTTIIDSTSLIDSTSISYIDSTGGTTFIGEESVPFSSTSTTVTFPSDIGTSDYSIVATLRNEVDPASVGYNYKYIVTSKSSTGFTLTYNRPITEANYNLEWAVNYSTDSDERDVTSISNGSDEVTVTFSSPKSSTFYIVSFTMENLTDGVPGTYHYMITNKVTTGFTVKFSSAMPTGNYAISWTTYDYGKDTDQAHEGLFTDATTVSVTFTTPADDTNYTIGIAYYTSDYNDIDSMYVVTEKTVNGFTLQFDEVFLFFVIWAYIITDDTGGLTQVITHNTEIVHTQTVVPTYSETIEYTDAYVEDYYFVQTGHIRNFDDEGTFDCTYGGDEVEITVYDLVNYLVQENGDNILLEDGDKLLM